MNKPNLILLPALALFACATLQAQVTFDGLTEPAPGAVLDLNSPDGVRGGLILSNVSLEDLETIPATFIGMKGMNLNLTKTTLTGAMVYHTGENDIPEGVYVWIGDRWKSLQCLTVPDLPETMDMTVTFVTDRVIKGNTFTAQIEAVAGASYRWTLPEGLSSLSTSGHSITITAEKADIYPAESITVIVKTDCGSSLAKNSEDVPVVDVIYDAQNIEYTVGDFGAAGTWMTENLRSTGTYYGQTHYTVPLYNPSENSTNTPLYQYPNLDTGILNESPEYGLLYSWAAANINVAPSTTHPNPEKRRGICPAGWHLPNDAEWQQLVDVISQSTNGEYAETRDEGWSGRKMKSATKIPGVTWEPKGTSKLRAAGGLTRC
jgi:uncharacterized protein (TIGR02145 family)